METDMIQHRVNRINFLIERLNIVARELDSIHADIFDSRLTRKTFTNLVTRRQNLLVEQQNKEKELREVYRLFEDEEGDEFDTIENY